MRTEFVSILAQRCVSAGNRIGVHHQGEGMVSRTLRMALLVGAVTAAVASPAWAFHRAPCCNDPCGSSPCAQAAPAAPAAPCTRTITVTECVPEKYTVKRTAYKYECKTETYDACKTECVAEVRERTCTVVKRVPVMKTETRKVCKNVTVYENRTVCKTEWKTVQEVVCKKELVRLGHWETREVSSSGFGGGLFGGSGGHKCGHRGGDCCDPCPATCAPACPRTKNVWVHCPEYCQRQHTVCKKVCVKTPTVCKVAVCKQVWEECKVSVCTYQCVEEKQVQKYTVMVPRTVNYKATRTVRVCVPYEETVTCTRYVSRQVTREVPATNACETRTGLRGLFSGRSGCGCRSTGNSCCK
jgi:hypothetical protein